MTNIRMVCFADSAPPDVFCYAGKDIDIDIASLAHRQPASLIVSLADKTHNIGVILADLASTGPSVWRRFTGEKDGTLWYYAALAESFKTHLPGHSTDRFLAMVIEMHARA